MELLKEQMDKYLLELSGYCLLGNHIYIVAIPHEQGSPVKGIGGAHFR